MFFDSILESHDFSDFRFLVNGNLFHLHKGIIIQRSGYFQKLFEHDTTLLYKEVTIPEHLVSYFPTLLLWIYSSRSFHVEKATFVPITHLAVWFELPQLLEVLVNWLRSNIDYTNVLFLYSGLIPLAKDVPKAMFDVMHTTIEQEFEMFDPGAIANSLDFEFFFETVSKSELPASLHTRSVAISEYLAKKSTLTDEQRDMLVDLYLKNDWAVNIVQMFANIREKRVGDMVSFTAKHLCSVTDEALSMLPHEVLLRILSSDDMDVKCEEEMMLRLQALTEPSTLVNKSRNREIWMCMRGSSQPRNYLRRPITKETLRCLILGSCLTEELNDVKETLVASGFVKDNIIIFNADSATPTTDYLFNFDVIFAFTHYQFEYPLTVSKRLTNYAVGRRGGIVMAYGFIRNDEWGCGEEKLSELMPVVKGPLCGDIPSVMSIETQTKLAENVTQISIGGSSPRANITTKPAATLHAKYADGVPLAVSSQIPESQGSIVVLNFYPASSRVLRTGWHPESHIGDLICRSVILAAGISNDCSNDS